MRQVLGLSIYILMLSPLTSKGAQISATQWGIQLSGEIEIGDFQIFKKLTESWVKTDNQETVRVIQIESDGGNTRVALQIHYWIQLLQSQQVPLVTYISHKSFCGSACLLIFLGSHHRWAHRTSVFGLHRVHNGTPGNTRGIDAQSAKDQFYKILRASDAEFSQWIKDHQVLDQIDGEWFKYEDLKLFKLVTHWLEECPNFLPIKEAQQ